VGVLTDFVVADRGDARRVCDSDFPGRELAGLDAKGIDTAMLGTLHALLAGGEFDPSFVSDTLGSGGENGPCVAEVAADLVRRLAGLDAKQLRSAGERWAATEGFSLSPRHGRWPAGAVQELLQGLASVCGRATKEEKSALMWVCLSREAVS
jgi:hypothetical protein